MNGAATPHRVTELPARLPGGAAVSVDAEQARRPEAWLVDVQARMRPGASIKLITPRRHRRRLRRLATHYFDVASTEEGLAITRRSTASMASHFESIAPTYWSEIPAHVQDHFFAKKIGILQRFLPHRANLVGLDLGCGVGRYAAEVQRRVGGRVVGLDPTRGALDEARTAAPGSAFLAGDVLRLPFEDESFDYAYTINVLHHLKRGEQERGLLELRRVLKPDGVLVVHEMNVRNPIFRWYLRHLYPKIRPIDRGDEEFIHPARWPLVAQLKVEALEYMTFVPDFAPRWSLPSLRRIEAWLERGASRAYSAHYAVVLSPA